MSEMQNDSDTDRRRTVVPRVLEVIDEGTQAVIEVCYRGRDLLEAFIGQRQDVENRHATVNRYRCLSH